MIDRRNFLTASLAMTAAASLPGVARAAPLAPFKLYDTHTHFYSSDLAKYPYRPDVAADARARTLANPVTPERLLKLFDGAGVERGCGVQYNTTYYTDNRYLLDSCEKAPNRFDAVVILSPTDAATPTTLKALARGYGITGVRFSGSPDAEGNFSFLSNAAHQAWKTAEELGIIVVLMPVRSIQMQALPSAMKRIGELAEKYPKVRIVIDHLGFPIAENTPNFGFSPEHLALAKHKNVFYKYTTFLIEQLRVAKVPTNEFLNFAVKTYGAEQFCWGTDIGNTPGEYNYLVQLALDSAKDLTLAQKKAIFYDNAKGLFIKGGRVSPRR